MMKPTRYGGGGVKNRFRSFREGPLAVAAFGMIQSGTGYANAKDFHWAARRAGMRVIGGVGSKHRQKFGRKSVSSGWDESLHPRDNEGKFENK